MHHRVTIEEACTGDAKAIAELMRLSREAALPYLPKLHTREEDLTYIQEHLLPSNRVYVARDDSHRLVGYIAFDDEWVNHLYLLPDSTRIGIGSQLLNIAKGQRAHLQLWCFQKNDSARQFYEKHGFKIIKETDGSDNEEKEPDWLFVWNQ